LLAAQEYPQMLHRLLSELVAIPPGSRINLPFEKIQLKRIFPSLLKGSSLTDHIIGPAEDEFIAEANSYIRDFVRHKIYEPPMNPTFKPIEVSQQILYNVN
jgi:hypothetical protein